MQPNGCASGSTQPQMHVVVVDHVVADAQRVALDAPAGEAQVLVELFGGVAPIAHRELDALDAVETACEAQRFLHQRSADAAAARLGSDPHAPDRGPVCALAVTIAAQADDAD